MFHWMNGRLLFVRLFLSDSIWLSVANEIEKELDESLVRAERLRSAVLRSAFEGRLV